ncbi:hypothetical protein NQZ68_040677 [Dissostichus eleginoides]|nr:hypothetical protein NQZ68_040677 [Dissostichus eleginoides]
MVNDTTLRGIYLEIYRDFGLRGGRYLEQLTQHSDLPDEVCRKKWKTLRDRYRKDKQNEKEGKRSGAGSSGGYKPWCFAAVMSFLNSFLIDRETSSNVPRQTLPPFAWQANPATLVPEEESQESQPGGSQPASHPILAMPPPPPPPVVVEDDEDLLFFKSLLPTMILMSRAKRLRVRFAIHKVVLDADQEEN